MVGVFRRSLSFPTKPNSGRPSPQAPSKPRISHHTRSISLPCRSHPLISNISHHISQLRSWSSSSSDAGICRSSAWISDGLNILRDVHDTLSDILHLPQSQDSLRDRPVFFENLLEDLLRFVDAYGIFQTSLLSLRDLNSAAQVALRKRDDAEISSFLKSRQNLAKDLARLTSSIREPNTKRWYRCHVSGGGSYWDAELASVIGDVIEVTDSVSVALINGVYFSLRQTKTTPFMRFLKRSEKKKETIDEGIEELMKLDAKSLNGLRKKKDEEVKNLMKIMSELENSICEIECGSEKVFRSLINTRVSLLNALTH